MVNTQLKDRGITDTTLIGALESMVVVQVLNSISIIYFNEDEGDLFGMDILYDRGFSDLGATPRYNGNISGIKWQTTENPGIRGYGFNYDQINQMLEANYAEYDDGNWIGNVDRYSVYNIDYDYNGNILGLDRKGIIGSESETSLFGHMDDLTYTYNGNQLKAVQDDIENSGTFNNDFKDNGVHGTVEYEYDDNGNLTSDDNKGILSITYNHLNLPEEIVFSQTEKINYIYTANGTKLKETITDGQMIHTFDYCGNLVYEESELSYILTPAGRAVPGVERGYLLEYFLHDHLGNVRVVFGDANGDVVPEVIQENHFYPFGMTMGGINYVAGMESRYLYQGKEITGDFNLWWHDFHARRFDSQLGRWHVTDPAGQFASPYVGMGNNPMLSVDPDGTRSITDNRWFCGISWGSGEIFQRQLDIMYGRVGAGMDDFDLNFIGGPQGLSNSWGSSGGGGGNPYLVTRDELAYVNPETGNMYEIRTDPNTQRSGIEIIKINPFPGFAEIDGRVYFFSLGHEVEDIWINLNRESSKSELEIAKTIFSVLGITGTIVGESNSTFRITNGAYNGSKISPKIYSSGWKGGSVAIIKTYSVSSVGKVVSKTATGITTAISYIQIYNGNTQPLTYVDAIVGTTGLLSQGAQYFYGVQIPIVGEVVAGYGCLRLTLDVFWYLGENYGPSKWYGTDDTRWFQ